jgi:hypothetical protein
MAWEQRGGEAEMVNRRRGWKWGRDGTGIHR